MEQFLPYLWPVIVFLIIVIVGGFLASFIWDALEDKAIERTKNIVAGIIIILSIVIGFVVFGLQTNTESFDRDVKQVQTNYNPEEVYREVTVVGRAGDVIFETAGHFDIEFSENRLRWIDEDGELNLIYLGDSATVLVEEQNQEETTNE